MLTELVANRFPSFAFDLSKLELNASARNPKLTFYDRSSHETIQLSNLALGLNKQKGSPVTVSLDSNVTAQSAQSGNTKNGSISLSGNLAQTLTPQGAFDVSKLTCSLHFKAQQLPSRVLDIVARAKGRTDFPFTTVFGNVINAAIDIDLDQFSGPVSVNVNTPNTRAAVNGTVAGGILTLKEDAHVQMKVTPEASRLVLKEVNPLNLSYFYSQAPVTLEVPAHGFAFRLYPFDYGKITIPNATIELGKILCKNEGNVHVALGLLKSKQFEKSSELMLWFAPIDLHIAQGIVDIERTEILLAETYDICAWGKVEIVDQYVDMILGLTAQTLKKAFGIKNLPDKLCFDTASCAARWTMCRSTPKKPRQKWVCSWPGSRRNRQEVLEKGLRARSSAGWSTRWPHCQIRTQKSHQPNAHSPGRAAKGKHRRRSLT